MGKEVEPNEVPRTPVVAESFIKDADADPDGELDSGQARLHELGYRQELRRSFNAFTSFACSLVLMANSSGITGFLSIAYINGGPVSAVYGWIGVSCTNLLVALSMAEIVSAYPIAGGPYFWVLELTKNDRKSVLIGWITGWLNVLGQFATTAGVGALLANHIANMWLLGNGHVFTSVELLLTYAIVLVCAGCFSSTTTEGIKMYTMFGAAFLFASNLAIVICLPLVAPVHQPASFVFSRFYSADTSGLGIPNDAYLFLMGTLMAQFTYIGYEAPAQFAEETKRADRVVPWGIVLSVVGTAVLGFSYLLTLLFCIQDPDTLLTGEANGYPVGQIFHDAFKARFGSGTGGIVLMMIPLVTTFNSGVLSLTTNARMLWSFSRDGGVPLYRVWASVNPRTGTPTNAVWAMTALAFLLGLPMLWSIAAFQAIGSVSSIGLWLSYGIPIVLRVLKRKNFEGGPFRLGILQLPINLIAIAWVIISTVAFTLPTAYPITPLDLNWTPVTVGLVMTVVLFVWFLPYVGARHWYHGKAHTLEDAGVRGACRYSMNFGRSSGSGRLPKLTLLNLLEDWKATQSTRALRRSLTAERRSVAASAAEAAAKPGGGGGSSKQVAPVDRGNGSAAKLLPEKLPGLPAELPSQGSLDRAASLDRSMAPSARPPRPPQPKASSFT